MKKRLIQSIILLILSSMQLQAQEETRTEYGSKTLVEEIKNNENRTYKLLITLPPNYNSEETYKVLYYLDAWWLGDMVKGAYGINLIANEAEKVIMVGISSTGNEDEWNTQRNMDFTPSQYDLEKMKISMTSGNIALDSSTTGGAEYFMDFLENEILRHVESTYKIDKETRGFMGHSFGGLLGFYALVHHNDLFKNYLLISPSVWWNKSELLTEQNVMKVTREANIFLVFGTQERSIMTSPIRNMTDLLSKKSQLNIILKEYEGANHHSVLPPGIYDGIKELYVGKHK